MSFMIKRGLVLLVLTVVLVVSAVLIWPGETDDGLSSGHWIALAGFFLAAVFAVVAAVALVLGVVGSAWEVDNFDANEYLDDLKRSRRPRS